MTDINIKARKIAAEWQGIGVEGDNGVEQYRFVIDRYTGNRTDLYEGIATAIFRLADGTEGFAKLDMELVDDNRIGLMWEIGSEVTQQPGTVLVSIHISGLEERLWNSEIGKFTVSRTLSQPSSQPTRLMTRKAAARIADPTQENPITVVERTIMIPAELQTIAVQNDENSEDVTIVLPRYFDGFDLAEHDIYLRTVSEGGRDDILFTGNNKSVVSNEIHLNWMLKPPQTSYNGRLTIQLVVKGTDFQWSSASAAVTIIQLIDGDPVIPNAPSMYDIWLDELDELREVALASIAQAKAAAVQQISAAADQAEASIAGAADEVNAAKDQALSDINAAKADAKDEIVTDVSKNFLPLTGGAITGPVTAPTPTAESSTKQLANVEYVNNHVPDLSGYVSKAGTSVVTGDLQVPTPATEESAVPREYADGNGYTQALMDGLHNYYTKEAYKRAFYITAPITFATASDEEAFESTPYCKLLTFSSSLNGQTIYITGIMGEFGRMAVVDLCLGFTGTQNPKVTLLYNNSSPDVTRDLDIVVTRHSEKVSNANQWILWVKRKYRWIRAHLEVYNNTATGSYKVSSAADTYSWSWVAELDENEITVFQLSEATQTFSTLAYADAVPYQYAKAAGFPFSESMYKQTKKNIPLEIQGTSIISTNQGIYKIAEAKDVNGTWVNLIIEGSVRNINSNSHFKLVCSQRLFIKNVANPQSAISFEGLGDATLDDFLNLVIYKENNLMKVYLQFTGTNTDVGGVRLNVQEEIVANQWTIYDNTLVTYTEGTIPGTKVWDLKTAWGSTSRTQITKEEVLNNFGPMISPTINKATMMSPSIEGSITLLPYGGTDSIDNRSSRINFFSQLNDSVQMYIKNTNDKLALHITGHKENEGWKEIILDGVADAKDDSDAVNLRTLNKRLAALEAKLTGKTVAQVMAANAIPAAAPTLEISSEEEEEITV